ISLGISLRTLLKRQRGFFLAFFGTGLFFVSFLSLAGAWSALMHSAHKWQEEWKEISITPIGGTQDTVDYFQKKFEDSRTPFWKKFEDSRAPFWNRFIAIKALKKINTPEAYQALFQELNHTNTILQQLILRQLEGQITLQQAPQIESLLEETSDRRFHQVGIRLLSTIPEKEIAIRLLNMSIPLPPETLMNRFTKEDVPQLLTKLYDSANCQKTAIFNALCSIDEEQALKSLETLVASQDNESQRVVLQWIEKNPAHPQRNNFLNQLSHSSFGDIQHSAKYLQEHSQKKSPKHSKRFRRSCQEEKD
ncbi:MAG: HEAT repeat domain-containing protein, partial [Planctomycetota bacterium]